MRQLLTLSIALLAGCTALAETQFICTYEVGVKVQPDLKNPTSRVITQTSKYNFSYDSKGNGKYINLDHGNQVKAYVTVDGPKTTFVEWNVTDNYFIATIFDRRADGYYPTIMSFHSWDAKRLDFYDPELKFGKCTKLDS